MAPAEDSLAAACTTHDTLDTELTADVVAFCPHPAWRHLMACGCYELIKGDSPSRVGRLQLLDVTGQKMKEVHRVDGPGILDCAWLVKGDEPPLLAAATADCTAQLYRLESDGTLSDVGALACPDAGDACMSLDWCSTDQGPARLALSSTAGRLFVLEAAPTGMRCLHAWGAHDLEGWSVAFDRAEPSTLYSGGDDAILKRWDLRTASSDDGDCVATTLNRRSHGAGVCCISPHPLKPHLVATGSYDEKVRLWDTRNLRQPTFELGCGGGVWRLKWHPEDSSLALAACMHAGFKVVRLDGSHASDGEPASLREVAAYGQGTDACEKAAGIVEGGAGLAYGADWAYPGPDADTALAGTCSFYDHTLHLWSFSEAES